MNLLAQSSFWSLTLGAAISVVCLFLMLVILIQRGRGGGLVSAFGGGGGSSAFGAKTGDVFTWITVVIAGLYIGLAVVGNWVFDKSQTTAEASAAAANPDAPEGTETAPATGGSTTSTTGGAAAPTTPPQIKVETEGGTQKVELKPVEAPPWADKVVPPGQKPAGEGDTNKPAETPPAPPAQPAATPPAEGSKPGEADSGNTKPEDKKPENP